MTDVLVTSRLRLRRARAGDAAALHDVFTRPEAMRFWSTPPHTEMAQTERWLATMIEPADDVADDFIVEHRGRAIGKAGCWRLPEIGFILHPDYWRQGIALEALGAVIPHLFACHAVATITADVDPGNDASLGLLRRLGFAETGRAARAWCVGGVWSDSVYLALTRPTADPASPPSAGSVARP